MIRSIRLRRMIERIRLNRFISLEVSGYSSRSLNGVVSIILECRSTVQWGSLATLYGTTVRMVGVINRFVSVVNVGSPQSSKGRTLLTVKGGV